MCIRDSSTSGGADRATGASAAMPVLSGSACSEAVRAASSVAFAVAASVALVVLAAFFAVFRAVFPAAFFTVDFSAAAFVAVVFAAAALFFADVFFALSFFTAAFFRAGAGGSPCRCSDGCSGCEPLDSGRGVTGEASWAKVGSGQVRSAAASRCTAAIGTGSQSGRCRAS